MIDAPQQRWAQQDFETAEQREPLSRLVEPIVFGRVVVPLVETPEDEPGHVYHLFVSRSPERDRIVAALRDAGIGTATYYLPPLHLQPALSFLGWTEGSLPETEKLARENFSVPLWAGIDAATQERVDDAVRAAGPVPAAK